MEAGSIKIKPSKLQLFSRVGGKMIIFVVVLVVGGLDFVPRPLMLFTLAIAFLLLLMMVYDYFYLNSITYEITDEQLTYEAGIFSITREFIELYRVIDYTEHRTFLQSILGIKTIIIISQDKTTPKLLLIGIPRKVDLAKEIRERVEIAKRNKPIYEITNR